jgi:1,4-dihydroxy-2-naphthoate octaprenyltransferase
MRKRGGGRVVGGRWSGAATMKPLYTLLVGILCLGLWVFLAFVKAIPSGWVHLPLAVGAILIAIAIIESPPRMSPTTDDRPPTTGL